MSKEKKDKNKEEAAEEIKEETAEEIKEEVIEEKKEEPAAPEEEDKDRKLSEANDKYLRLLAEYDNFRKRSSQEKENLYADIKADTLTKFLPVYDNLERALNTQTEDEAYKKGVEMIMAQFKDTMQKLGATAYGEAGETFDPNLHNAVMHCEDEEKGENEIVEVFQKGFKIGDKVVRFAMVKVAN